MSVCKRYVYVNCVSLNIVYIYTINVVILLIMIQPRSPTGNSNGAAYILIHLRGFAVAWRGA